MGAAMVIDMMGGGNILLFAMIDDGREDAAYGTHLLRCSAGVALLVIGYTWTGNPIAI